ncbi:hypothetical protein AX16_008091 [Volvariella volvacea WC 439]|nr:hypothetical protein AX16_008091 [Volvariella volvacea WC 439]
MPASKRKRKQCKDSAPESDHFDNESDANVRKTVRWEAQGEQDQDDREQSTSDTEDNSVAPDKVYLAAFSQHNRIGCAYYDPIKCVLFVLEDTQETPQFDLTPDLVLTSSKSDDDFIDAVRSRLDEVGGHCQIRPHKEFVAAKGRDRLLSLHLLTELPSEEVEEHLESSPTARTGVQQNVCNLMRKRRETSGDPTTMRWNALIRLSNFTAVETSPLCMASVGALIDHLVRERALGDLADDGIRGLDIRDIEALCLNQVMQINADALFSLQVFENESHASVHSDKTKEGLSLFGILNNTRTALGRSLLRTWFLRPSLSLSVIQARHDAVACFTSPENTVTVTSMHNHLKGVKNVPRILGVMRTGKARLADWQGLVKFTFYAAMLRETIIELHQAGDVDIVQRLVAALDIAIFREVGAKINEIIDWEESSLTGRVCVRPHVDEELDNKKHVYHGIDSVLVGGFADA